MENLKEKQKLTIDNIEIGKTYKFKIDIKKKGVVIGIGDNACIIKNNRETELIPFNKILSKEFTVSSEVDYVHETRWYDKKAIGKSDDCIFFVIRVPEGTDWERDEFVSVKIEDIAEITYPFCFVDVFLGILLFVIACLIFNLTFTNYFVPMWAILKGLTQ